MANLILPARFTSQPQYLAAIDWGNPITTDLAIAVTGQDYTRNLANRVLVAALNSVASSPGPGGIGILWTSYANSGIKLGASDTQTLLTSAVNGAGKGLTYFVLADPVATGVARTIPFVTGGTGPENYLQFNANRSGTVTSGMFSVSVADSGVGGEIASAVDGKLHAFAVTYATSNTAPKMYWDGVDGTTASSAAAAGLVTGAGINDYIGGYSSNGYAANGYGIYLALGWNRELSASQIKSLSDNPWQIFKAPQRRLYMSSTGAAANSAIYYLRA